MAMRPKVGRPKAGQARLSRESILATALELVDTSGMDALSMRRLAAALGVDPMAIYRHLPGKDAVITGLVGLVFGELQLPACAQASWHDGVRAVVRAYRRLALTHPNLVLYLVTDVQAAATAALDLNEALYGALAPAGLSPWQIVAASDLLVDYVNGFVLGERARPPGQTSEWMELRAVLDEPPPERFPALRRVLGSVSASDPADGFETGLDIILAGVAATAAGAGHAGGGDASGSCLPSGSGRRGGGQGGGQGGDADAGAGADADAVRGST